MNTSIYPENSLILAPLSGFTDISYRCSARRHGCIYAFTEMIDAGSLIFGNRRTLRLLERGKDEKWLGAQLIGAETDLLRRAAEIINKHDFDVLDFNIACPAPKVVRKGEGIALAKRPEDAVRAFETLVKISKIPVTAKIRILDRQIPDPTVLLAKRLENAGAAAITVHGRTREQFYSGEVYSDIISAVRSALRVQVIANGGVMDYPSYCKFRRDTGCDCVMVARGAMGNPWIFEELSHPDNYKAPTVAMFSDEIEKHVLEIIDCYGESLGFKISRKVILDYLRGRGYPGSLKNKVCALSRLEDFKSFIVEVRNGPSHRYKRWLERHPSAQRRLMI